MQKSSSGSDAGAASVTLLSVDSHQATAFNGDLPLADIAATCGADDRRFLGELLGSNSPLDYKVPKRLADIKPAPGEVLVTGTITKPKLGAADFPFDHTLGSDFYADVMLDAPFHGVGQERAAIIDTVHVELAAGQFPHRAGTTGLDEEDWRTMRDRALDGLQDGFVPMEGDRVLLMGHWVMDCGHVNFQTELHPITFLAIARTEANTTVVHAFYNPYREMQLYHPDSTMAVAFESTDRLTAAVPFPQAMIDAIYRIQDIGPAPYTSADRMQVWPLLEPNVISPIAFRVCAPRGRGKVAIGARVERRAGVEFQITPDSDSGCALVRIMVGDTAASAKPVQHTCVTPWDFLSEVASEAAAEGSEGEMAQSDGGAGTVDIEAKLATYVAPANQDRLRRDPAMNCYDALSGPDLGGERPSKIESTEDSELLLPLYGTIVVKLAAPP